MRLNHAIAHLNLQSRTPSIHCMQEENRVDLGVKIGTLFTSKTDSANIMAKFDAYSAKIGIYPSSSNVGCQDLIFFKEEVGFDAMTAGVLYRTLCCSHPTSSERYHTPESGPSGPPMVALPSPLTSSSS